MHVAAFSRARVEEAIEKTDGNIFKVLQDLHTFAPLQIQHFMNKSIQKIARKIAGLLPELPEI